MTLSAENVQRGCVSEERERLEKGSPSTDKTPRKVTAKKSSHVLDPVLVDGLVRVGGRLRRTPMNDVKHPIVLRKDHHVVGSLLTTTTTSQVIPVSSTRCLSLEGGTAS